MDKSLQWLIAALLSVTVLASAEEPDGDRLLRQMCTKLAAARTFSFQASREIDPALLEGRDVPEKAKITATVHRPNQLTTQSVSKAGKRRIVADGRKLIVSDEAANTYTEVAMPGTLDALVARLADEYGFTPPLAEFALSDPYGNFHREARTVTYAGQEKVSNGFLGLATVDCHRLSLKGPEADAELWIATSDLLPRKLIATFHRAGQPQVKISFARWDLAATADASTFSFVAPKGAEKVEMWTTAQMRAVSAKR
jgi:hypothetical protein